MLTQRVVTAWLGCVYDCIAAG